ncbi:MAG: competence type IV pilus major pilin ComGC [Brevinematia bacterium]
MIELKEKITKIVRENRAFSLVEILIVLAIIGILLTIAIPNLFKAEEATRKRATEMEIRGIISAIYSYRLATYQLPKSIKQLVDEGYLKSSALTDEWGTEYNFQVKGNKIMITSAGPDKKFNTKDDITIEESF